MDNNLKKIAGKIAKCMAMATSDNPAEAEAGRRQAEALMRKHGLTGEAIAAAQVKESAVRTGKSTAPLYMVKLAALIAKAFGCQMTSAMAVWREGRENSMYFFGFNANPELASYTFDVLRRHLAKDRKAYQETLYRYKRSNKIRLADLFCAAWVDRIGAQVRAFAGSTDDFNAIDAYVKSKWGDSIETDKRKYGKVNNSHEAKAVLAGLDAARDVLLHKPMRDSGRIKLIE